MCFNTQASPSQPAVRPRIHQREHSRLFCIRLVPTLSDPLRFEIICKDDLRTGSDAGIAREAGGQSCSLGEEFPDGEVFWGGHIRPAHLWRSTKERREQKQDGTRAVEQAGGHA